MRNVLRSQTFEEEAQESSPWAHLHIPVVAPTGWTPQQVDAGIRSLDRLRRELDAATSLLVAARPDDRDATAALSRLSKITNKESRKRRAAATVITALPRALDLLRAGELTVDHVAAMRAVADKPGAADLLESGVRMSPEELPSCRAAVPPRPRTRRRHRRSPTRVAVASFLERSRRHDPPDRSAALLAGRDP